MSIYIDDKTALPPDKELSVGDLNPGNVFIRTGHPRKKRIFLGQIEGGRYLLWNVEDNFLTFAVDEDAITLLALDSCITAGASHAGTRIATP